MTIQPFPAYPLRPRSLLFAALLAAAWVAWVAAQSVDVVERHPVDGAALASGEALYVRVAYRSEAPIRFQARGYRAGTEILEGVRMNPAPPYPAGSGDALVWIAYTAPVQIDEVRVLAYDGEFREIGRTSFPTRGEWGAGKAAARAVPPWVTRLNAAQQRGASAATGADDLASPLWRLLPPLVGLSILGYFILQLRAVRRWQGVWRLLSLLPLVVTVPIGAYTLVAYAAGSNLWPLLMIFTLPFAFVYLAALTITKFLVASAV